MIQHLDLFSGIGGFALAGQMAYPDTWRTIAFCEIDKFCRKVLNKNFPGVPIYNDITKLNGYDIIRQRGEIQIITGGFPCQPFSVAGERGGNNDDRALWKEMFRVITEIRPAHVLGENVAGIISMELDNVLSDMESVGYTCRTFVIPACAKNAPHRRDRVWIVGRLAATAFSSGKNATHADRERQLQQKRDDGDVGGRDCNGNYGFTDGRNVYEVATELCRVDDGIPGRVDRNRAARLKALGNAIVPQVAADILKAMLQQ